MIIVLCGVRGSGKDTIGDILRDKHKFKKESFAAPMKEMVKHAFPAFTNEDLYGPSKNRERGYPQYPFSRGNCPICGSEPGSDENDDERTSYVDGGSYWRCTQCATHIPKFMTPRFALQTLGTNWGRALYSDVWIDAVFERIRKVPEQDMLYLKGVGRLPGRHSGRDWVITDGRFLNEIRRSRELGGLTVKLTRGLKDSKDMHPSEAEFRSIPDHEFDIILDNANISLEELPGGVQGLLDHFRLPQGVGHG